MSTSAVMSLGVRAMFANYAGLQTTGNNIANANVDGYSRQQVDLETAQGQFTGAGFFGKGVNVKTVTRSYDEFLTREADAAKSLASSDQARYDQLQQLEQVFPTGESGMGYASGQLLNAMVDVANNPQDTSARQVVLSRANDLVSRFSNAGGQLDALQAGVTNDLGNAAKQVNAVAESIAAVNRQIAAAMGTGQPPNDLLDQRDRLVAQLSTMVQVTTVPSDDGSLGVFIAGGQPLVLGNQAATLSAHADLEDASRTAVDIVINGSARPLRADALGGSIGGLLTFQNKDLVDARNLLGQMATALAERLNTQQARGIDLNGSTGQPMFNFGGTQVGAPQVLARATNQGTATVGLTITDPSALQAGEYRLSYDGTNWLLTQPNNSAFATRTFTAAQVTAGVSQPDLGITIGPAAGAAAAGDSFLLQPVSRAVGQLQVSLSDPRALAAALPLTGTLAATNTGTSVVASLSTSVAANSPLMALTTNITFTAVNGGGMDYSWSASDGSTGTGTWTPGQPLSANGFSLSLTGVPKVNDQVQVKPTVFNASNNGNALAMAALRDETFVGRIMVGASLQGGTTITDAYAGAMGDIGVRVQSGKSAAEISQQVATSAEQQRSAKSGVNLDEEAAKLIQYQQSYQAAAKVLQVAQSVFDTLLQTTGG